MRFSDLLAWTCTLVFATTTLSPASAADAPPTSGQCGGVVLPMSARWDMASTSSGVTYRISVIAPDQPPPPTGFPVVYVTDADVFLPIAAGQMIIRSLQELRPAIVVGIAYPTADIPTIVRLRNRDLTPPTSSAADAAMLAKQGFREYAGGADAFYRFLKSELEPELARRYLIDSDDATLFGHSLGGLFVLHVLFEHPGSFRNYVAASPSLWWDDARLLKSRDRLLATIRGRAAPRLLTTIGGLESDPDAVPAGFASREEIAADMKRGRMVANAEEFGHWTERAGRAAGLDAQFVRFDGENHLSVQSAALARALTFALARPTLGNVAATPPATASTAATRSPDPAP